MAASWRDLVRFRPRKRDDVARISRRCQHGATLDKPACFDDRAIAISSAHDRPDDRRAAIGQHTGTAICLSVLRPPRDDNEVTDRSEEPVFRQPGLYFTSIFGGSEHLGEPRRCPRPINGRSGWRNRAHPRPSNEHRRRRCALTERLSTRSATPFCPPAARHRTEVNPLLGAF